MDSYTSTIVLSITRIFLKMPDVSRDHFENPRYLQILFKKKDPTSVLSKIFFKYDKDLSNHFRNATDLLYEEPCQKLATTSGGNETV